MPINTNININDHMNSLINDRKAPILTNEIIKVHTSGKSLHFCTLDDLQKLVNHFNKFRILDDYEYCSDYYEVYQRWCEKEQLTLSLRQRERTKKEGYLMRAENNKANKKYKCETCELYTNNQKLYSEHILSREHFEATSDQDSLSKLCCTACGKDDFKNLYDVQKHESKRECVELRTCPICKKTCSRKQTFDIHLAECKERMEEMKKQFEAYSKLNQ